MESRDGKGKWGSSTDRAGNERVIRTEVDGWGWGGVVGQKADGAMRLEKGRWSGMSQLSEERREEFEDTGRRVWREMEELRKEWEGSLNDV